MKTAALSVLLLLAAVAPAAAEAPSITTVILVRHAEKASETDEDSPLNEAGERRAVELSRVLRDVSVDAIYTTQFIRTRNTAEPLAKRLQMEAHVFPAGKTYASDLVRRIRSDHAGQTVVVVGHSNTTVHVLKELGVADPGRIEDSQYDHFFICTLVGDQVRLLTLRYGLDSGKG